VGPTGPEGPQGIAGATPDAGVRDTGLPYDCPPWKAPPGLGGAIDSEVTLETAQRWKDYRAAREQERMWEQYDPIGVRASYRIEQEWVDHGCISQAQLIDLGRALFLRSFSLEEGLGNGLANTGDTNAGDAPRPNLRRFQRGYFGGPDATGCYNCHWKGGLASGGDRADNAFLFGDGDDIGTHDQRNPPSLWGAGWTQIIAQEMSRQLAGQAEEARALAAQTRTEVRRELRANDVDFGHIIARPDGADGANLDYSDVVGVDTDLVIKPFGWKGVFATLRGFVAGSLHFHFNLQPEELVEGTLALDELDLGGGPEEDPDNDGVLREFTEGQLTALIAFLATLDTPVVQVPTEGGFVPGTFTSDLEIVNAQEFTIRWLKGAEVFQDTGCADCHKPLMPVRDPVFRTIATMSGSAIELDLTAVAAHPQPERRDSGVWMVPVFSDFRRHEMGSLLEARHVERGVPRGQYLTRRLWGLANTRPYMHDGSATRFDEAIALHGGEGSEAQGAATAFADLTEDGKASLRVFLLSLRRAPAIRIR
jgi:mono/diheme cytochrome c family protein